MLLRCKAEQRGAFPFVEFTEAVGKGGHPVWEGETTPQELMAQGFTLYWTHDDWRACKLHNWQGWRYVATLKHGRAYAIVMRSEEQNGL